MKKIVIHWLGTGSGLNIELGNTSFIILGDSDRVVLVDCGFTVPGELIKKDYMSKITDIIITHAHADHIGGLESFGFMHYYALKNRNEKRPVLHLATDKFAHELWENSLKGGMEKNQDDDNNPFDATLETFFKISIGKKILIDGFPVIDLFNTQHVKTKENYGLLIPEKSLYYSGDAVTTPPNNYDTIFQDCQFYKSSSDVHTPYTELEKISSATKKKTWLIHLSKDWSKIDPVKDGFAGFVMPGKTFVF